MDEVLSVLKSAVNSVKDPQQNCTKYKEKHCQLRLPPAFPGFSPFCELVVARAAGIGQFQCVPKLKL